MGSGFTINKADSNSTPATHQNDYTVEGGDTLSSIAAKKHVSVAALRDANPQVTCETEDSVCVDDEGDKRTGGGDLIYPGDVLTIPRQFLPYDAEQLRKMFEQIKGYYPADLA